MAAEGGALLERSLNDISWLTLIREPLNGEADGHSSAAVGGDAFKSDGSVAIGADGKPNLSYAELIRRAIESSESKRMTLNEIYQHIADNYPYYREMELSKNASWKNSIRHNLSLNRHFVREQRDRGDPGKGSYWRFDESQADEKWSRRRPLSSGSESPGRRQAASRCGPAPRVNPVIQKLFASDVPTDSSAHDMANPYSDGSGLYCSWASMAPSIPELGSSMGSVDSQLGASWRNLYRQVYDASFSSFGMSASMPLHACPDVDAQPSDGDNGELFGANDMSQFQSMNGSMSRRKIQDWLCDSTNRDQLAMSWQFFTQSIGMRQSEPPFSVTTALGQQSDGFDLSSVRNAPTPAAIDVDDELHYCPSVSGAAANARHSCVTHGFDAAPRPNRPLDYMDGVDDEFDWEKLIDH